MSDPNDFFATPPAPGYGTPAPGYGTPAPGYGAPQVPMAYPGMPYAAAPARPGAVTAVGVLIYVGAGFLALAAVLAFGFAVLAGSESSSDDWGRAFAVIGFVAGLVLAGLATLYGFLGHFLLKGSYVAMIVVTVFNGLGIAAGLFGVADGKASSLVNLLLSALILFLLWNRQSQAWFAAHRNR